MSADAQAPSDAYADAKRLAIEIIATLVNIKKIAVQQILTPAGVPNELLQRFLADRNPVTGQKLSKREAAAVILTELASSPDGGIAVIRELVAIASTWENFHLSSDEFAARGVVQKARAMQGLLVEIEAAERAAHEAYLEEAARRRRRELTDSIRQHSPLLLAQFDAATASSDPHERGYLLQELLNRLFDVHGFPVRRAFQRNEGAEQIDGAFEMEGWHYIVECRWRKQLANIRELDGLCGQVTRSGHQTMGLFLSINGWSENVPPTLKQNGEKRVFLMEGLDLRTVLAQQIDLRTLLKGKLARLNVYGEPYISVVKILN